MARFADPGLAERRRKQILAAAMTCFRRRGFHQTSVQEICEEAAMSAGALYRYFPSKTAIIAAIVEEDRREVEAAFAGAACGDLIGGICQLAKACVEQSADNAALVADVVGEAIRNPELARSFARQMDESVARIAQCIEDARARGEVRTDLDAHAAARMITVTLDGLALHAATSGRAMAALYLKEFRVFLDALLKTSTLSGGAGAPIGGGECAGLIKEIA